ncbi:DNA-directed RNA polymerase subunit omega [candidate division NPL-UPA2 bacterium Unc8]|uniref:DNA-directed RNA polymerase subunit omega n=1 Tax=candidate division NPL-UPA2 bacterium Unc8 TaxID=1980939 RepID=A0A399FXL5_UNCN2|nr:DNA-directed RNA polymerase subunit omega [Bacillota bacterium]MBT9146476.1 DNA-directed RNA polymerase subunit omega [Bacillota bacterium]RII00216.1 MAG: DNA-directed RNA polymerase subunit omega [candidate division NPL-UPA2 bacterium Unc8]
MLNEISIEELRKKVGSVYKLVNLAAMRARDLNDGAPKLVNIDTKNTILIALTEIAEEKIRCKKEDADKESVI